MRRKRSTAVMHGSEPIIVETVHPMDQHPVLKRLDRKRIRAIAGRGRGKTKVKVKVDVVAKTGDDDGETDP